jgi:HAAS domain-containing protein
MNTTMHPLAGDYLRRLERLARDLPRRDRDDLIAEIRGHLEAGLPPDASEADVRNRLDELGPPEAIVAAAGVPEHRPRRGAREVFALVLLVTGLPPLIGWVVGAGLLLWSPLWTARQKLLGLLVWPGGYVLTLGVGGVMSAGPSCQASAVPPGGGPAECAAAAGTSPWLIALVVIVLVAPLLVGGYLYRAAGRSGA